MKCLLRVLVVLALMVALSGCFLAVPINKEIDLTPLSNMMFGIVSDTASEFVWLEDDVIVNGQTQNNYNFWATADNLGLHKIEVQFMDEELPQSETWNVYVHYGMVAQDGL